MPPRGSVAFSPPQVPPRDRVQQVPPESNRRAGTEVTAAEEADGWRCLTWRRDGGIDGVLRFKPLDGAAPWSLEVPGGAEPMRALAVLHAVERLLREVERSGG